MVDFQKHVDYVGNKIYLLQILKLTAAWELSQQTLLAAGAGI